MPVDAETFRNVLGSIPAGVSVITAIGEDGHPRGLTSTAVCSVSLEPPLLLICVDKTSNTLPALRHARSFVVNVLADGREARSRQFASKDPDKFRGVRWEPSSVAHGAPILVADCAAHAACIVVGEHEAGDHIVFLASVEAGSLVPDREPLVFLRGAYRGWPLDPATAAAPLATASLIQP